MKKVSKLLALILITVLAFTFTACDIAVETGQRPAQNNQNQGENSTPGTTPGTPSETPDEIPDETPDEIPNETPDETPEDPKTAVESITLDKSELVLTINETCTLVATVLPENATNKSVEWESSDTSVILVSDGVVCAVSVGTATVTAIAKNGVSADCVVTVEPIPEAHVCIPAEPTVENKVDETCTEDGSYDIVVYCAKCDEELSRETNIIYTEGHNYIEAKCEFCDDVRVSSVGLTFTLNDDGESYALTNYGTCTDKNVIVTTYEDKPVTAIEASAFSGKNIVSVVISNSVTEIGRFAFSNCKNLVSVKLPQNITIINESLFNGCTSLVKVSIPEKVETIGASAFYGCTAVENIIIPESVKALGASVFNGCTAINNLIMANSVTEVGKSAFYGCTYLKEVKLSTGLSELAESLFYGCTALKSVNIPDSVTKLGTSVFYNCKAIENITLGKGVSVIGNNAFYGCAEKLSSITVSDENTAFSAYKNCLIDIANKALILGCKNSEIPADGSVLVIKANSFYNAKDLEAITVSAGVTTIENGAFGGCDNLKVVTFGKDVCNIGVTAFPRTPLETLIVDSANNKYHSVRNCVIATNDKELIMGCKNSVIPTNGSVTSIGSYAFHYCNNLESIIIPDKVTNIGLYAFSGCSSLQSIIIPDNVKSIGIRAFSSCSKLESVTIGMNLKRMGIDAFLACGSLREINFNAIAMEPINFSDYYGTKCGPFSTSYHDYYYGSLPETIENGITLNIGADVTVIPKYLFLHGKQNNYISYYTPIITVNFAENSVCTTIETETFDDCFYIENLEIPSSVTSIPVSLFGELKRIKTLTIGEENQLYSLVDGNLYSKDCKTLIKCFVLDDDKNFVIPNEVEIIHNRAFNDCDSLIGVTIGNSVTSIGDYAFYDCDSLTSVTIGDSVTSIGERAFYSCDSLTSITIGNSITSIKNYAFCNCSKLKNVYYTGTEEQWSDISIGSNNNPLTNSTIHYNYTPEE